MSWSLLNGYPTFQRNYCLSMHDPWTAILYHNMKMFWELYIFTNFKFSTLRTYMWLASNTVDSLWATIIVVLPFAACLRVSLTICSLFESSADVASSSSRMGGSRIKARAIAILCFWPPDSWVEPTDPPTTVSYPYKKTSVREICFLNWGM